jgi:hypothetical protein
VSKSQTTAFAPAVLRSLDVLMPSGQTQADLGCELGLSAWMHLTGTQLEEAPSHLWAIRQAIIEAGRLDAATEPTPIGGRSPRLDLLNLVSYLGDLVARAAAHLGCDRGTIIALALDRPILRPVMTTGPRVRELRTS